MLPIGCSSVFCLTLSSPKSQSSSVVSFEKSASTAPALVPVAREGRPEPGDQAKVAVRGISLKRPIFEEVCASCQSLRPHVEIQVGGAEDEIVQEW